MNQTYDRSTNSYIVNAHIGDKNISMVNHDATIFNNVIVYAADRWSPAADVTLRNLIYFSYP